MELRRRNIGVTLICPGAVASEIRTGRTFDSNLLMGTDECCERIIHTIEQGKREEIMTTNGRIACLLKPFFPEFVDRTVEKAMKKFYPTQ